ncbi:hypothetical protein M2272_005298 [Mycobacterium frederiksbergense]|uniref:DNA-binding protein n=1 Tax=Mycolicibacterium frederiksbergense TaxID=117567 RepID=A0ABT6L6U3_9MYCO|nr:helix-turn-helix domain-containing protein [Mycolicibacterium frederiksbergense]MDH6198639.1 hypothetical protein [Mycolicibacterium frederiksbergense]
MQANSELDQLLQDRFDITTTDFVAALKTLPTLRPWAASLTEDEARLLDDANFAEDRDAFLMAGTEITGHVAHLAVTALTADEVATGLGVSPSRVRQKRLAGELWAIPDGQTWLFPVLQFETDANGGPTRQIRGLDQVFKALPSDLHPVAVAGFLRTPQLDLFHDRPMTPVEWLRDGGDLARAVAAAASADWYTT